jgi:arylsulfatase A-like enzyme
LAKGNTNDPQDAGLVGGYADALGAAPHNGLQSGLDYVDAQLGAMVGALKASGISNDTLIIITAKHGQSPIDVTTRVAASDALYAGAPGYSASITDDVGLVWLSPAQQKADYFAAESYLRANAAALHIDTLLTKDQMAPLFHNPFGDPRTPDFVAITHPGVIYTGGSKLAEHGGFALNDRNVALLVSNPGLTPAVRTDAVETRQVAPTILRALGISGQELAGAHQENTKALPGLSF